uniref:Uncharacterized protein n=1 Tax=Tanacetum cinerariifolium TaxID=118510 RepID=A0A6L2N6X9_TANCI|nr:hypothetical protein [Tanacetum cinerariifolium]
MNPVVAQQISLDNALVAPKDRVNIRKCNMIIDPTKTQKEVTYQVVMDTLTLSPCYNAFLITTGVPEIYMQQFWFTISKIKDTSSYQFKLQKRKSLTTDDNIIFDDPERLVTKKSTRKRKLTSIVIKDTPDVSKKKTPVQAQKHKGMKMLSKAASLEEAQTRKALKISRRETSFRHQTCGSSEGAGSKPEVLDEPKGKSIHTSDGAGSRPEVPDVSKVMSSDPESKNKSWGEREDDNDDRQSNEEMTDAEKVNVEHEQANQEVKRAQVQNKALATTTAAPATHKEKTDVPPSSSSRSKQALFETMKASKSFNNHPKHMALYHALIESILTDEDAMDQGVANKQKKRKPADDNRDEDPPTGPDQGLKRMKTSKDAKSSKRPKSTGSSNDNTSSQPKPKSTGKSVHTEETIYKAKAAKMPQNQGDDMGTTDEQPNVKAAAKKDWFKKPERPLTPDPEWNQGKSDKDEPTQDWLSDIVKSEKPPFTFNELICTPIDFSAYAMNRLKFSNLKKADLVGPVYNILKVTNVKVNKWYGYDHLEEIKVRRADQQLYKFMEGDFPRLYLHDIEDILLFTKTRGIYQGHFIDRIEVLRYDTKGVNVRKGKMQTKTELTLEQTQQGVSDEVLAVFILINEDCGYCNRIRRSDKYTFVHVTSSEEGKRSQDDDDKRLDLADGLKEAQDHIQVKLKEQTQA